MDRIPHNKAFDDMLAFARGGNVYIYGTGGNAAVLSCILKANDVDFKGFTYSPGFSGQIDAGGDTHSICVTDLNSDVNIILGANVTHHSGIYEQLKISNIASVFPESDFQYEYYEQMFDGVTARLCLLLSDAFEVDAKMFFESEILTLNKVRLPNFFIDDSLTAVEKNNFLIEVGDLLLPYDGKRYFSREGPYEVGKCIFNEGDTVFDLGAAFGVISALAATKGCEVFAFEPSIYMLATLKKTMSLYDGRIRIVPAAVSDFDGFVDFADNAAYGGNHIASGTSRRDQIRKVESVTIDNFAECNNFRKIDYIKADIEGAERDMLRGANNVLRKFSPKLSLCTYHYHDDKQVMERLILEANPNYAISHNNSKLFAHTLKQGSE